MITPLRTGEPSDPSPAIFINPNAAERWAESFCEDGEGFSHRPFTRRGQTLGYIGIVKLRNGETVTLTNEMVSP